MADIRDRLFKNRKVNLPKLLAWGFEKCGSDYIYRTKLSESGFQLTISFSERGELSTQVLDPSANEAYGLHLIDSAVGPFVGGVKSQYEQILAEIAAQCFDADIFKSAQAKALIAYVRERRRDELEFLWPKFPANAIWRRRDTGKWYAALLTVSKRKLGLGLEEKVEIIDLRAQPEEIEALIDKRLYFPGYHMNKKHWYTIILDGRVELAELCRRIDRSYSLALK